MVKDTAFKGDSVAESRQSLWLETTPTTEYDPLNGTCRVDTAIVGGGITGLSTAIELKESGQDVAVIESDRIAASTTGNTTAKLTSQHGLKYDTLRSKFGEGKARQYAEINEKAIDAVQARVEAADIDCDFQRTPAYTYAESSTDLSRIHDEVEAARRVGLPATFVESAPLPFETDGAIRFDDQAEFHPRKYLLSIAEAIDGDGSYVFEGTRATDVKSGGICRVGTETGTVVADQVVVASHFPFYDGAGYFARMHPKRSYLLAARVEDDLPKGMYYRPDSPSATIRTAPVQTDDGTEELLIIGGQSHNPSVDGIETSERYRRCKEYAEERFAVESFEYRWSTHDYSPVDKVPFIGQLGPGTTNVYVATGFGGWGMTGGVGAAIVLRDLIVDGSSQWADVFNPLRITPKASAKSFATENATTAANYATDWARAMLSDSELPAPGDGTILRQDGRPVAVHRDMDGNLHAVSAICTHLWCLVRWNDAEKTWDCPCHGSRFSCDGEVLSGPALEGLRQVYPNGE